MTTSPYLFTSERLGFRLWTTADLEEFAQLNADRAVMEHFPSPLRKKEVKALIERLQHHYTTHGFTYYATQIQATGEFIGMIGLSYKEFHSPYTPAVDIGWRLKQSAWGKGYATEGAKRCLKLAFTNLQLDQVIAICPTSNHKSEKVMQQIGMQKLGTFDHPNLTDDPRLKTHLCYQTTKSSHQLSL